MSDVHLPVMSPAGAAIARDLQQRVAGQVRFGSHDRMLYSTDASIYQVEPIGVVVPKNLDDVQQVVDYCRDNQLAILPRGGGTSLAGQAVNHAIILDFSAWCTRINSVDTAAKTTNVEPGVVLATLNQRLQRDGLLFGPDVATATHANIGGMIGNNSAGARSIRYGRTVENLHAIDAILADGTRLTFDEGAAQRDPRIESITQRVADVILPVAEQIDARFPKILRRCGGYNLDLILSQLRASTPGTFDKVNLAHLLCGSEGTLAVTAGATLSLTDMPRVKGLTLVAFASVEDALQSVMPILATNPTAVELVDDVVIGLARNNRECSAYVDLMPRQGNVDPSAVLYVEHYEDDADSLDARFAAMKALFPQHAMKAINDPVHMMQAWKLRASGEPLLHGVPGKRKPLTFVEDAAVDPSRLCEFIAEFRRIVESHGTTAAYYAHASVGCLHVRPMIDLRNADDRVAMTAIAEQVTDLARRFGGSHSAEHGDGRLRSHLLERFFGGELCDAFGAIKHIFDPDNRLNPGNIVQPQPMLDHLRVKPHEQFVSVPPVETYYSYEREGGFGSAVEMCNGAGVCRQNSGGTMCPSYRGTREERHATRGRGNALRLAITGQLTAETPAWNDPETLQTLDLCLSCKACKRECPSNVDVAKLKAEYLAHSHDAAGGPPLSARLFGNVRTINRLGSAFHQIANATARLPLLRHLAQRVIGIDARRSLPRFERSLYRWFGGHISPVSEDAPAVVLFPDCFTVYNEPHIGRAAVRVLEALGYRVILPKLGCCGRSLLSVGMLPRARDVCGATAAALIHTMQEQNAVATVVCEPSCLSAILDDWPELQLDVDASALTTLTAKTHAIEDFIERRWNDHPSPLPSPSAKPSVHLHGHCHQKALWGVDATTQLLRRFAAETSVFDAGCCGMAGSFGYTHDHYDLSMRIGELSLMPAVRQAGDDVLVAAPGTSCRHQIKDATGIAAVHPIEIAARALA